MLLEFIHRYKLKIAIVFMVPILIIISFILRDILAGNDIDKELPILFASEVKANAEIPYEWFIISSLNQYNNWIKEGLILPKVDFSKNYLIVSKYKIKKLYSSKTPSDATGVPDGIAVYDEKGSKKGTYYTYIMDRIMLSEGIG